MHARSQCPFVYVTFPSIDAAQRIVERCVGVRNLLHVYAEGTSVDEMLAQFSHAPLVDPAAWVRNGDATYKIVIDGFGVHLSTAAHGEMIRRCAEPFTARARMRDPDSLFWLVLDRGLREGVATPASSGLADVESRYRRVALGRQLSSGGRSLMDRYDLRRRVYLGTTSMKAELALIQANMAHACAGRLVYDPFVGTGSLIVAAAAFGASVLGSDLSIRTLRGDGKRYKAADRREQARNVAANFTQYGLESQYVGVVCGDAAVSPLRVAGPLFDAIVTDPPWGLRAGAKRVGPKTPGYLPSQSVTDLSTHIPQTVAYRVETVLADLLRLAARTLVLGGRLSYWLPTTHEYSDADLPSHPCFDVVGNCAQILQYTLRRRLVTMVKVRDASADMQPSIPVSIERFNEVAAGAGAAGAGGSGGGGGGDGDDEDAGAGGGEAAGAAVSAASATTGAAVQPSHARIRDTVFSDQRLSRSERKRKLQQERDDRLKRSKPNGV